MASLAALAAATAILVAIPGPNVAMIVSASLSGGFRRGAMTVLGTTSGVALQVVLVILGLSAVIARVSTALTWVRWGGIVYLVWLGLRMWREAPQGNQAENAAPVLFWRGCLVALINPKTLLFNAAFLPQFFGDSATGSNQAIVVGAVFLLVLLVGDLLWAAFAGAAKPLLVRYRTVQGRLSGGLLIAIGAGLAWPQRVG